MDVQRLTLGSCVVPSIAHPVLDKEHDKDHKLYSPKRKVAMHHEQTMILLPLLVPD